MLLAVAAETVSVSAASDVAIATSAATAAIGACAITTSAAVTSGATVAATAIGTSDASVATSIAATEALGSSARETVDVPHAAATSATAAAATSASSKPSSCRPANRRAASFILRHGLLHLYPVAVNGVEFDHCGLVGAIVVMKVNEAEAPLAARLLVGYDLNLFYRAEL